MPQNHLYKTTTNSSNPLTKGEVCITVSSVGPIDHAFLLSMSPSKQGILLFGGDFHKKDYGGLEGVLAGILALESVQI